MAIRQEWDGNNNKGHLRVTCPKGAMVCRRQLTNHLLAWKQAKALKAQFNRAQRAFLPARDGLNRFSSSMMSGNFLVFFARPWRERRLWFDCDRG
jgi:hypothetical protein